MVRTYEKINEEWLTKVCQKQRGQGKGSDQTVHGRME